MGNYISCALTSPAGKHSRAAKVIFPTGEIRHFYQPTKAAELMLDTPNSFLVNSVSLRVGQRFSALNADEDLEMANAYVVFPMSRLGSVVTAADVGVLFRRVRSGNVRISPVVDATVTGGGRIVPKLNLDDIEELSTPEFKHLLSMCRSKKPLLETIAEEPICSR